MLWEILKSRQQMGNGVKSELVILASRKWRKWSHKPGRKEGAVQFPHPLVALLLGTGQPIAVSITADEAAEYPARASFLCCLRPRSLARSGPRCFLGMLR